MPKIDIPRFLTLFLALLMALLLAGIVFATGFTLSKHDKEITQIQAKVEIVENTRFTSGDFKAWVLREPDTRDSLRVLLDIPPLEVRQALDSLRLGVSELRGALDTLRLEAFEAVRALRAEH